MLGDTWTVEAETTRLLEAFVCTMYGCPRETSVNTCRNIILKRMVGEDECLSIRSQADLCRMPPCQDNLVQHIRRANYRLCVLKNAQTPILEHPDNYEERYGWVRKNNVLEPLWVEGPILPETLICLIESVLTDLDEELEDLKCQDMYE